MQVDVDTTIVVIDGPNARFGYFTLTVAGPLKLGDEYKLEGLGILKIYAEKDQPHTTVVSGVLTIEDKTAKVSLASKISDEAVLLTYQINK